MDLSILKTVNKPEEVSPEDYVAPTDYSEPSPSGDYIVRLIDGKFKDKENAGVEDPYRLSKTKKGDLQAEIALEVVDGAFKGKRFFDRINLATFPSGKGNTWFNALMGFGNKVVLGSPEDYVKALDKAILKGASAKVFVDREWYCNPNSKDYNGCGVSTKGEKKAQALPDGSYDIRITCPGTAHPDGQAPLLLARNVLSKYRVANNGQQQ